MAKAKESEAPQPSGSAVADTAKEMFLRVWQFRSGTAAWAVAVRCYEDAMEFHRIADKIASGMTPKDVLAEQALLDKEKAESQNTGG